MGVAGFDLVRLATGAWGTLGVITQVSLRLHARPAVDETFALGIELSGAPEVHDASLRALVEQLNSTALLGVTSSLAALVVLAHDAPAAVRRVHALPESSVLLLARATGNRARVDAQRNALAELGAVSIVESAIWQTIRTLETGNTVLRVTDAPLKTSGTWRRVETWRTNRRATQVCTVMEPLRGAVRVSCQTDATDNPPWTIPERAIAERLPSQAWTAVPSAVNDQISQRLRQAFDPAGILNPGILGEATAAVAMMSPS